jgi:3-deoxy-manno-octulosonate cytidylyltransferase (CMP-KDO synthetase)
VEQTKVLAILPLRLKSTRIPEKILAKIGTKALCVRSCERAIAAFVNQPYVQVVAAVDDPRTQKLLEAKVGSLKVIATDPELPSGTDRVFAATTQLISEDPSLRKRLKGVMNIQGDMPFMGKAGLQAMAEFYSKADEKILTEAPMLTLAQPWPDDQKLEGLGAVKLVSDRNDFAIYFSRYPIPYSRLSSKKSHLGKGLVRLHLGVYGFSLDSLARFCAQSPTPLELAEGLEQLRAQWLGMKILVLEAPIKKGESYRGIDVPADLRWAKLFAKGKR